jgi:hypothetical protein
MEDYPAALKLYDEVISIFFETTPTIDREKIDSQLWRVY